MAGVRACTLTDETREMLSSGAERIYGFGEPHPWDGRWLLVVVRVPEQRRDVRHLIRSQLAWAGFGSLGNGLWISPHVDRESEVRRIVSELSPAELLSFRAEFGSVGDPAKVIADAWDVGDVADRYREFIIALRTPAPQVAGGDVPRPDGDGAYVAEVPVPRPGPTAGDAPGAAGRGRARTRCSPAATTNGGHRAHEYFSSLERLLPAPGAKQAA